MSYSQGRVIGLTGPQSHVEVLLWKFYYKFIRPLPHVVQDSQQHLAAFAAAGNFKKVKYENWSTDWTKRGLRKYECYKNSLLSPDELPRFGVRQLHAMNKTMKRKYRGR